MSNKSYFHLTYEYDGYEKPVVQSLWANNLEHAKELTGAYLGLTGTKGFAMTAWGSEIVRVTKLPFDARKFKFRSWRTQI